jgi:hypothetical protein
VTPCTAPPTTPTTTTPAPFTTPPHHNTNYTNHSLTFPSTNQWFLFGHNNTTTAINHQTTTNNTHPTSNLTSTPTDTNDDNPNNDEEEIAYTQSDYAPAQTISASKVPSNNITVYTNLQTHHTFDKETHDKCKKEGHVWSCADITLRTIVIKLAIMASATCNQKPITNALEPVIDAVISSLGLSFHVDRIAILHFDTALPTWNHGNVYFTYAFLSPHSTNPTSIPPTTPYTT